MHKVFKLTVEYKCAIKKDDIATVDNILKF